jgi:hypothetical protein
MVWGYERPGSLLGAGQARLQALVDAVLAPPGVEHAELAVVALRPGAITGTDDTSARSTAG